MIDDASPARKLYEDLTDDLLYDPAVGRSTMMGHPCMRRAGRFFASFDPGGFITVDKPPVGLWVQAAFARVFGYSGTSLLLPEALAGVAAVLVLYLAISRVFGRTAYNGIIVQAVEPAVAAGGAGSAAQK